MIPFLWHAGTAREKTLTGNFRMRVKQGPTEERSPAKKTGRKPTTTRLHPLEEEMTKNYVKSLEEGEPLFPPLV